MGIGIINVTTREQLEGLGSALTIEGLCKDAYADYIDWVNRYTPMKRDRLYITKGEVMNSVYGLTGDNAYPDDLHIVSINLNDMEDYTKIIMRRFDIGARWLDDIIANNVAREEN